MSDLSPRLKRALELVYGVDGVAAVKLWQWDGRVAVAVRPLAAHAAPELLGRVEAAVAALREPGEAWDFGVLDEEA
jgi:hypothetical protein